MKVIDLLTKIANGEEVPKKIKFEDYIYEYNAKEEDYYNEKNCEGILDRIALFSQLNNFVEIIEEDKKIEKISNFYEEQINENGSMSEPFNKHELKIINKINEIIDYLNKGDESNGR